MASDIPQLPPGTREALAGAGGMFGSALLARLLWHRRNTQRHGRRFWTADLAWQFPIAAFCTLLAIGVQSYLALSTETAVAISTFLGWIGPGGIQVIAERLLDRYAPRSTCVDPPEEC